MLSSFEKQKNLIYFNAGSVALSPKSVIDKVSLEKKLQEQNPTLALFGAWTRMWDTQRKLAAFFKADPKNFFLRPNVTYIMNDFIMAVKLPPGSEILISDLEYGAVVKICEEKARLEGHSVRAISLFPKNLDPEKVTEDMIVKSVEMNLRENTKLVMFSHVMTGNGLTIPAEKIAALLRDKKIVFAVDGAHGAGACTLDFANTKMDFYGSNMHKWMMGPKGTAFGYVSPLVREQLNPKFAGWTSGEIPPHFLVFGDGDQWTARWMINSTHNFSDFYGIDATVDFWQSVGVSNILEQRQKIYNQTQKATESLPWKNLSRFSETLQGPLMAFDLPENLSKQQFGLMNYLFREKNIVVSMTVIQGKWCLRLSPHIYNTEAEIALVVEALHSLKSVF